MTACAIVVGFNHWDGESLYDKTFTRDFVYLLKDRNPNLTILLIDNFSGKPYPTNIGGNVEVLRLPRRVGYGVALNIGLKHLQARDFDWYICMNNDCWIHPNPKAPADHGRLSLEALDRGTLYGSGWNVDKHRGLRFQWSAWLCISREILEAVGYFDEGLSAAFEDFDYEQRALNEGFRLDTAAFPIVHLDEHTRLEDKNYPPAWEKARLIFAMKHGLETETWFKV